MRFNCKLIKWVVTDVSKNGRAIIKQIVVTESIMER